jgi:undecaprenyl-diphosphatase
MHALDTFIAKYFILLAILLAAYAWWQLPRDLKKPYAILAIASGVLTLIFAKIGSHLYYDPRPFVSDHVIPYFGHSTDNGFPSDHTLLAAFLAFFTVGYNRKIGGLLFVVAILIGGARVIGGVHHGIDVIGSFVIAGIAVGLCYAIRSRLSGRNQKKPTPPAAVKQHDGR